MIILVRFRGDILRGLRVGAILFAVLLVGVAVYRVMREAPPPDSTVAKPPAAEPAAVTPTAAVSAPPPLAVPAPPPISSSHPQVRRRPAGQPTEAAASEPPVEPEPAASVEENIALVAAKSRPQ